MRNQVENHLEALNSAQAEAVSHGDGPLLILAGAGTGKTKVLTNRIAHLIHNQQALPSQIMAVTFTNKAAAEMKERVNNIIGYELPSLYMGTFHSLSAKILRKNAQHLNLNSDFTIIDTDDQLRLIKNIQAELNIDSDELNPKAALNQISLWKDKALKASDIEDLNHYDGKYYDACKKIYPLYQAELLRSNSCDFGDLILHVITLLGNHEHIQQYYNNKFKYILVDEYQDTNVAQYLWLRLLVQGHNNICCVGDDDQSIYGFRGAEIENILRFERDFPGAKIVKLEENYRSTNHILNAASKLIATNEKRHHKTLYTSKAGGDKIKIISNWDDRAESRYIINKIETLKMKGSKFSDSAILVRASFQTRSFEEALLSQAIPYRIVGGQRFYDRKEIKDIIAYLRIIHSEHDNLALERIINTPKRGVGPAGIAKINQYAREAKIANFTALINCLNEKQISGKAALNLEKFKSLIEQARNMLTTNDLKDVCKFIIEKSGYLAMLKDSKEVNAETKIENLKEFSNALGEFENLVDFLEHVSLVNELQNAENEESVNILTLHASKGLEFDNVFLPGWEESLFPHQRSINESGDKGIEEERRLAYVGITRAKKKLFISHATNRRIYNKWQISTPSRFLSELPEEDLEHLNNGGIKNTPAKNQQYRVNSNFNNIAKSKFTIGQIVAHDSFGEGSVKSMIGDVVEISFNNGKTRYVTAKTIKGVK